MYTKGEWFNHNGTIETAYSPNGHVVAVMNDIGDKVEADGNLIASAPKLYEALKAAQARLEQYHDVTEGFRLERQIQEALSSAEGK